MATLDEELESLGENVRLVSLSDGSVNGLKRWWCTLSRKLRNRGTELAHGEAESALAALRLAKSKLPAPFQAPNLEDLL